MRRGQVGLEYVAIIVLALVVLVPAALYLYQNTVIQSNAAQAELAATKIAAAADSVKAQAPGAKVTVEAYVPKSVNETRVGGREVLFRIHSSEGKLADVYRVTAANLTPTSFPTGEGILVLEVIHETNGNVSLTAAG